MMNFFASILLFFLIFSLGLFCFVASKVSISLVEDGDWKHLVPEKNHDSMRTLLKEYALEILLSTHKDILLLNDSDIFYSISTQTNNSLIKLTPMDICQETSRDILFKNLITSRSIISFQNMFALSSSNPVHQKEMVFDYLSFAINKAYVDWSIHHNYHFRPKDMLIVYSTCNQLQMSILSLQYLNLYNKNNVADLLIVDDYSTDGTPEYLRKKGFAVVSKPKARGLTDSWNLGYQIACRLGYKHILIMNNDVLITKDSLSLLNDALRNEALVAPMTTEKGAGHNPAQSISTILDSTNKPLFSDFVNNPFNAQKIQKQISSFSNSSSCSLKPSKYGDMVKFNGFSFGINIQRIKPAAYLPGRYLFDPSNKIVGQEDSFTASMLQNGLIPKMCPCVFFYHFKSTTVSLKEVTSKFKVIRPKNASKFFDVRENVAFYHNPNDNIEDFLTHKSLSNCSTSSFQKNKYLYSTINNFNSTRFNRILNSYPKLDKDLKQYPYCVYSSSDQLMSFKHLPWFQTSHKACASFNKQPQEPRPISTPTTIIAIVTSDPVDTSSARDILTAQELHQAFQQQFKEIEVKYLPKGKAWYDLESLYDVDILIVLIDSYDLTRIMPYYMDNAKENSGNPQSKLFGRSSYRSYSHPLHLKPNFLTIGWVRNWGQRWLSRPWIGNYDLLLVSSELTKNFFELIQDKVGFQTICTNFCPAFYSHLSDPVSDENLEANDQSNYSYMLTRSKVPIEVFPLASSLEPEEFEPRKGNLSTSSQHRSQHSSHKSRPSFQHRTNLTLKYSSLVDKFVDRNVTLLPSMYSTIEDISRVLFEGVDYIFTGSYYQQYRKIMDFQPSLLPQYKGRIIGNGWDKANVSSSWEGLLTGNLPYEIVKQAYKYVKITIDDSNHVTYYWGSLNSRVFDALASGSLIISDCRHGIEATFGPALRKQGINTLPVYDNSEDLISKLTFYLENESIRKKTLTIMQEIVLSKHSYRRRAHEFHEFLNSHFQINWLPKESSKLPLIPSSFLSSPTVPLHSEPKISKETYSTSLCIGIRTMPHHLKWLPIFLESIFFQYQKSPFSKQIKLQLFLVDTENNLDFHYEMIKLVDLLSKKWSDGSNNKDFIPSLNILFSQSFHYLNSEELSLLNGNKIYGYEETDRLLEVMMLLYEDSWHRSHSRPSTSSKKSIKPIECEWIMFTNGDNMYNTAWFDTIAPYLLQSNEVDIIGWDFISRHKREIRVPSNESFVNEAHANTVINIELKRGFVDLASFVAKGKLYYENIVSFLPKSILTEDIYARDYFTLETLKNQVPPSRVKLIHECLLIHQ